MQHVLSYKGEVRPGISSRCSSPFCDLPPRCSFPALTCFRIASNMRHNSMMMTMFLFAMLFGPLAMQAQCKYSFVYCWLYIWWGAAYIYVTLLLLLLLSIIMIFDFLKKYCRPSWTDGFQEFYHRSRQLHNIGWDKACPGCVGDGRAMLLVAVSQQVPTGSAVGAVLGAFLESVAGRSWLAVYVKIVAAAAIIYTVMIFEHCRPSSPDGFQEFYHG
jgi:hypothetical protein